MDLAEHNMCGNYTEPFLINTTCQELGGRGRLSSFPNYTVSEPQILQLGRISVDTSAWLYISYLKVLLSYLWDECIYRCWVLLKCAVVKNDVTERQWNFDRKLKLRLSKNSAVHSVSVYSDPSAVWDLFPLVCFWVYTSLCTAAYCLFFKNPEVWVSCSTIIYKFGKVLYSWTASLFSKNHISGFSKMAFCTHTWASQNSPCCFLKEMLSG